MLELRIRIRIEMRTKGAVDSIIRLLKNKPTLAAHLAVGVSQGDYVTPDVRIGITRCFLFNIFTIIMWAQNYPRCMNTIGKPVYGYVEDKPIISEYYDFSMPI